MFAGGFAARTLSAPSHQELLKQVDALLAGRQFDLAKELLTESIQRFPQQTNTQQRMVLAKLSAQQSDWNGVICALQEVPKKDPQAVLARIAEGDAWRRLFHARQAERCWEEALDIDPEARSARNGLLYLYSIQLRRTEWFQKLWEFYDRGQATQNELQQLLIAGQVVWETSELLKQVASFAAADPQDINSQRALAVYLLRSGNAEEAIKRLGELREQHPDDGEVWLALAETLLAVGKAEEVQKLFAQPEPASIQQDYRYWKFQAMLQMQQGAYDQAAQAFEQSVRRFPYDLEVRNKFAQTLRYLRDVEGAQEHSRVAGILSMIQRHCHTLQANGWDLERVKRLISLCAEMKLVEEAIGWCNLALTRAPADPQLQEWKLKLRAMPKTSSRHLPNEVKGS